MKRLIGLLILLSALPLFAQDPVALQQAKEMERAALEARRAVTKVITLKYPNNVPNSGTTLLDGLVAIKRSGAIVVVTGPQDKVDIAEAVLKQLDVPPAPAPNSIPRKNIELTAYLIIASPSGTPGPPLPKELESPVTQVASVFPYKSFHLFDAIVMRIRAGEGGNVTGVLPQGQQTFPAGGTYSLNLGQLYLYDNSPDHAMGVYQFKLVVGIAESGKEKLQTVSLQTNIDMKEGQKVVVGKANIDGSANAIIVVLTAKVVD